MEFEQTPAKSYKRKPIKIAVMDGKEKQKMDAKQQLKNTLKLHRKQIRSLKADIKKHKLLMRQARITYKLSK